jgi:hypothetical protein
LFKTATEHKEQIRYFSQQDLRELFSLPKGGFDVSPTQQQLYEEHYNQIKLDEKLESHVKFLETLGIAGVSHHSLLFSKTAPIQAIQKDEEEQIRRETALLLGRASASISQDTVINGYYHQQPLFLCQIYVVLFCIISHRFEKKLLLTGLTMLSSQRM